MSSVLRPTVIAGNWKMYKTIEESTSFIEELHSLVDTSLASDSLLKVYLAVPYTVIKTASDAVKDSKIVIGAQNMNDATEGAFTGEIAGKMLKDAGAKFVILGHSERRRIFKESNEFINKKVLKALSIDLPVILCIGETKEERDTGKTQDILSNQLKECLKDVSSDGLKNLIIAYEPVWAIGTLEPATADMAESTQSFCRQLIADMYDQSAADSIVIQYGGSVKACNAKEFLDQPNIDGLLVGGASLSAQEFAKIINSKNV